MSSKNVREVISISVGQGGVQLGFFKCERYCKVTFVREPCLDAILVQSQNYGPFKTLFFFLFSAEHKINFEGKRENPHDAGTPEFEEFAQHGHRNLKNVQTAKPLNFSDQTFFEEMAVFRLVFQTNVQSLSQECKCLDRFTVTWIIWS